MLTDTHNHTCHFSPDAKMTIDELIEAARSRNIGAVAITEHYEYDNPDPNDKTRMRDFVAPDGFTGNAYGCLPKDAEGNEVRTTIIDQKDWD